MGFTSVRDEPPQGRPRLRRWWAACMTLPEDQEPPGDIRHTLEEALDLLAALEEARDALIVTDHLAEVAQVEHHIRLLSRRLGFDEKGDSRG